MEVKEQRTLKAHDKLLIDVIKKQAGSEVKALTEGVMNSIEAGAKAIYVEMGIDKNNKPFITIKDDGIGINSEQEIIEHFETFGHPHEKNENIIWKQFRMGRGQMFAFGRNVWRTSQFQMEVDINNSLLDYNLIKGLPVVDGCIINIALYNNPIGSWQCPSLKWLKEKIEEQVRYVKIPIFFNNELVSVDINSLNWDFEDDNAYYIFSDTSGLKIYNLGIYVKSFNVADIGVGGVIVSKKRLDVNFARNDIQSTCPIFSNIQKVVKENKIKKVNKEYVSLSNNERLSLLKDFRDGTMSFRDLRGKRIFKTSQGKWISWNMFASNPIPWTFSKDGSREADKAIERNVATCFSESILNEINYSGNKDVFFDWLFAHQLENINKKNEWEQNIYICNKQSIINVLHHKRASYLKYNDNDYVLQQDIACLRDMFKEEYNIIPVEKYTKREKIIVKILNDYACWDNRLIGIGSSTVASVWTDGKSYIMIDRSFLKELNFVSITSSFRLFFVLIHEMIHDVDTAGTHIHGPEFYEKFYEILNEKDILFINSYYFIRDIDKCKVKIKKYKEEQKEKTLKEKLGMTV